MVAKAGQMFWNEHQSHNLLTRGGKRFSVMAVSMAVHNARSWRSMASSWASFTEI